MTYDSNYEIHRGILGALGGDISHPYDSVYSIDLEILKLVQGGVSGDAIETVDVLPEASAETLGKIYRWSEDNLIYATYVENDVYEWRHLGEDNIPDPITIVQFLPEPSESLMGKLYRIETGNEVYVEKYLDEPVPSAGYIVAKGISEDTANYRYDMRGHFTVTASGFGPEEKFLWLAEKDGLYNIILTDSDIENIVPDEATCLHAENLEGLNWINFTTMTINLSAALTDEPISDLENYDHEGVHVTQYQTIDWFDISEGEELTAGENINIEDGVISATGYEVNDGVFTVDSFKVGDNPDTVMDDATFDNLIRSGVGEPIQMHEGEMLSLEKLNEIQRKCVSGHIDEVLMWIEEGHMEHATVADFGDGVDPTTFYIESENFIGTVYITASGLVAHVAEKETDPVGIPSYETLEKKDEYLFEADYSNLNYEEGKRLIEERYQPAASGCSAIAKNNSFGHNFDYQYSDSASFIVRTKANGKRVSAAGWTDDDTDTMRYATLGMAGGIPGLNSAAIENGSAVDLINMMPFVIVDGINEKGLACAVNMVPSDKGTTTGTVPEIETRETICGAMLVRYILDNFEDVEDAMDYIRDYVSVYMAEGFELHFMLSKNSTYVIEFIDNQMVTKELNDNTEISDLYPVMTNFHLDGVELVNGEISYTDSNVEDYGQGIERYNSMMTEYENIDSADDIMGYLTDELKFTHAYDQNWTWKTEFTGNTSTFGDLKVSDDISEFSAIMEHFRSVFLNRHRSAVSPLEITWQTVHTAVYNKSDMTMLLAHQENADDIITVALNKTQPSGIPDAPTDGSTYGRNNGDWVKIEAGGGSYDENIEEIIADAYGELNSKIDASFGELNILKQGKLTASTNISISSNNYISATGYVTDSGSVFRIPNLRVGANSSAPSMTPAMFATLVNSGVGEQIVIRNSTDITLDVYNSILEKCRNGRLNEIKVFIPTEDIPDDGHIEIVIAGDLGDGVDPTTFYIETLNYRVTAAYSATSPTQMMFKVDPRYDTETWTFTLDDESTIDKNVHVY